mgnify:CR=1 FL=1
MKLDYSDYSLIILSILSFSVATYRFIMLKNVINHSVSIFILFIGLFLLWLVYKRHKEETP